MRHYLFTYLNNIPLRYVLTALLSVVILTNAHACIPTLPISGSTHLMGIGNSFIGRFGSSCQNIGQLLSINGDAETIIGTCDVMYGNPLENMLDEQVIQNAQSGIYDIGMFISGPSAAMEALEIGLRIM